MCLFHFVHLFEIWAEKEKKRENSHVRVHSPNAHSNQGWDSTESRNLGPVSHVAPSLALSPVLSQDAQHQLEFQVEPGLESSHSTK